MEETAASNVQLLDELTRFIATQRRLPQIGEPAEDRLARWVQQQVAGSAQAGWWRQRARQTALERLVADLESFVATHHRMPNGKKSGESGLYSRVLKNRDSRDLDPQLRARFDEALATGEAGSRALWGRRRHPVPEQSPAGRSADRDRWMLAELEEFVDETGRAPQVGIWGETSLARWVRHVATTRNLSPGKMIRFDQVMARGQGGDHENDRSKNHA